MSKHSALISLGLIGTPTTVKYLLWVIKVAVRSLVIANGIIDGTLIETVEIQILIEC